ncbi:inositol polyphosphate 5-phosphatase K-like isoform X2 [Chiloscyllium plagiosum]|uniref:inositol polyphosphate 5-phosphatase K-like isoform X2 n=1 Tax=Chiloscyllium plagiosum TaxID=36176 RepID=UPI001CB7FBC9|nr:inositol polyphosphate 5-phosphatase K-like isoform X2 [Chiloscyllium plagiosum]
MSRWRMEQCLAAEGLSVVRGVNKLVNFGLHVVSWNVGTAPPPDDLSNLLHLDSPGREPDMYVIGLQELNSKLSSFLIDLAFHDAWTIQFTNSLAPLGYVKITSIRMQGVLLLIFVKCPHLPYIRDLETNYTRTGVFGYWVREQRRTVGDLHRHCLKDGHRADSPGNIRDKNTYNAGNNPATSREREK